MEMGSPKKRAPLFRHRCRLPAFAASSASGAAFTPEIVAFSTSFCSRTGEQNNLLWQAKEEPTNRLANAGTHTHTTIFSNFVHKKGFTHTDVRTYTSPTCVSSVSADLGVALGLRLLARTGRSRLRGLRGLRGLRVRESPRGLRVGPGLGEIRLACSVASNTGPRTNQLGTCHNKIGVSRNGWLLLLASPKSNFKKGEQKARKH